MRLWALLAVLLAAAPARADFAEEAAQAVSVQAAAGRAAKPARPSTPLQCTHSFRQPSPRPPGAARERARRLVESLLEHVASANGIPLDDVCPLQLIVNPDEHHAGFEPILNHYGARVDVFTLTTALITLSASDDELASILAHELAHRRLGHRRPGWLDAYGTDAEIRKAVIASEHEADALGLTLMARAGYDPKAAAAPLDRLGPSRSASPLPQFAHPFREERARNVARLAPGVPAEPRAAPLAVRAKLKALGY